MRSRKGFEKPIEIFVALFIILAVALVLLKLFQDQVTDRTKEIADIEQKKEREDQMNEMIQSCQNKCIQASNNGCSTANLASLCMHGSVNILGQDKFIDLNNDKTNGYDDTLLAGIGVCEERLYCFHVIDSCCNQEISAQRCSALLGKHWERQGLLDEGYTEAEIAVQLNKFLPPKNIGSASTCDIPDDAVMWSANAGWE